VHRPAWNFAHSPPRQRFLPAGREVSRWNRKRASRSAHSGGRRFKQSSKGKRGRRKKKANQGGPASFRESVIHRDIAESLLTEVSMIPTRERFNSCPNDYVRAGAEGRRVPDGANPSRHEGEPWAGPGYRCIFNTETKRYNPRLIGKLHLDRPPPSLIQIARVRYRGYQPPILLLVLLLLHHHPLNLRPSAKAANLFSLAAAFGDSRAVRRCLRAE